MERPPRLLVVAVLNLLGGCWLQLSARRISPGWARLLCCIPVLVFNVRAHELFDPQKDFISKGIMTIVCLWAANFKVLPFLFPTSLPLDWSYTPCALWP